MPIPGGSCASTAPRESWRISAGGLDTRTFPTVPLFHGRSHTYTVAGFGGSDNVYRFEVTPATRGPLPPGDAFEGSSGHDNDTPAGAVPLGTGELGWSEIEPPAPGR